MSGATASGRSPPDRLALDRDAVHQAAVAVIVVHGVMPGGAVVPEGDGAIGPLEAVGVFRADRMLIEIIEQWLAFGIAPAVEAQREPRIDVERLAAGDRMADGG